MAIGGVLSQRASDAELWISFVDCLKKPLNKQSMRSTVTLFSRDPIVMVYNGPFIIA